MSSPKPIPDWYAEDWTPAVRDWELQPMSWDAFEAVVESSALPPSRKTTALNLYRALWLESATLAPLDLLQQLLLTTALAFDPGRSKAATPASPRIIPTQASGPLPRWSFTDLEMVLTCTWSGTALFIATERHHDFLEKRTDRLSAVETVRQFILLTAGLPCTAGRRRKLTMDVSGTAIRVAA